VPFPPSHPTENPERRLRIYLPDPIIRNQFLDTFYSELGACTLVAFTREYVQGVVVPRALQGEGIRPLAALDPCRLRISRLLKLPTREGTWSYYDKVPGMNPRGLPLRLLATGASL
jgi:hypothetical protein